MTFSLATPVRVLAGLGEARFVALMAVAIPYSTLWLGEAWGAEAQAWDENAHPMEASAAAYLLLIGFGVVVLALPVAYMALRAWRGRAQSLVVLTVGGALGAVVVGGLLAFIY